MAGPLQATQARLRNRLSALLSRKGEIALLLSKEIFEDRSLLPLRIYQASRKGRYLPGTFRAPFGTVTYVDAIAAFHQLHEIFHEHIYDIAMEGSAPTIVDCGGHIGLSVIRFKQRYPEATITVYEADPKIADVLESNVQHLSDVRVVRAAVGSKNGLVAFAADGAECGRVVEHAEPISDLIVPCVRLSDEITSTVDMLKMDIEGSEYAVIQDLCATGKIDLIKNMVVEVHGDVDTQPELGQLWLALTDAGFRLAIQGATPAPARETTASTPFTCLESSRYNILAYAWRLANESHMTLALRDATGQR